MTVLVGEQIKHFQLLVWKQALKLEMKGLRHSKGAIRPRIAASLGLRPRQSYEDFLTAIEKKIEDSIERRNQ